MVEKCPICKKAGVEKFRPFCSARCADVDLGRWLTESYKLPTNEAPEDAINIDEAHESEE